MRTNSDSASDKDDEFSDFKVSTDRAVLDAFLTDTNELIESSDSSSSDYYHSNQKLIVTCNDSLRGNSTKPGLAAILAEHCNDKSHCSKKQVDLLVVDEAHHCEERAMREQIFSDGPASFKNSCRCIKLYTGSVDSRGSGPKQKKYKSALLKYAKLSGHYPYSSASEDYWVRRF